MNKIKIIVTTIVLSIGTIAFGAHGDNHRLAGDIIHGLGHIFGGPKVVVAPQPAPVVVAPQPVAVAPVVTTPVVTTPVVTQPVVTTPVVTTPVVTTPTIPAYTYGVYQGVSCPMYNGYYFYNNTWCWGGVGVRHPMPTWRPSPMHMHHPPHPPHHAPIHHHR